MSTLELAADIAKPFEGLSLDPYHDPVGFPTIGYGHLLSREPGADLARWPALADEAEAQMLLQSDVAAALASVRRLIAAPLGEAQEAALVDFAFNCGAGNLQLSTLRRVINRGEYDEAPTQFRRWVYARGRRLKGLMHRREAEVEQFLSGPGS